MKLRFLILSLILLTLGACAPPQLNQDSEIIAAQVDDLTVPKLLDCGDDFLKPEIISPHQVIVDATPPHTFEWILDCIPQMAELEVDEFRDPSVTLFTVNITEQFGAHTSNLQLQPATSYSWTVFARNKNNDWKISNPGFFTTGPICTAQELVPPTLVTPADGTVTNGKGWGFLEEVHTTIKYPANGCTPEYFESDLSLNADFSGNDNWNIGGPGNIGKIEGEWKFFEDNTNGLQDCSLYYWRARAIAGTDYSD